MARKRMFDKELIDCDLFIDLPIPSQCLYFHLSMRADDEGFIGNVKGILRLVGFKDEDLRPLVERKFIIVFENGVIVIKHWKLNNYLRGDRCKETIYLKEKSLLNQDNNGVYNLGIPNDNQMETIGRHSIDKSSIEENSIDKRFKKPTLNELQDFCKTNNLKIDCERFINYYDSKGWLVGKTKMKDWKATARNWNKTSNQDTPEWFGKEIEKSTMSKEEEEELRKGLEEFK